MGIGIIEQFFFVLLFFSFYNNGYDMALLGAFCLQHFGAG